jgi:phosphoenolpyruvate carboxykinase (ATP)
MNKSLLLRHHIVPKKYVHRNLPVDILIKHSVGNKEGILSRTGAVVVYTGKYTGRSPKDRFIVDRPETHNIIDWGAVNAPIAQDNFEKLYKKIGNYLSKKENLYLFDGYAGEDKEYKLRVRVISEYAYQSLFIRNLLRRPTEEELKTHARQTLTVICAPNCFADPLTDGTNSEVFIILDLERMVVLIGGTKYAGEIKKSIFAVLNYLLPQSRVLPMHSSVNVGRDGDAALFFGLSGTGKTTLSADTGRMLIGDDEHGWSKNGLFNFEGGCYAKCINLKKDDEPIIWNAIKTGAVVENVVIKNDGNFDFSDITHTENTRVAYPLNHVPNAMLSGISGHPKTIIFLTADAFGILPPIAKLTRNGAVYHFLSGYTSKTPGTERGITKPKAVFSAYFGEPFMPLKPHVYAALFKHYIEKHKSNVYLINTGWSGGPYGVGKRISLKDTRSIVTSVLTGSIEKARFRHDSLFNFDVPLELPGINSKILFPRNTWRNRDEFDRKEQELANLFTENFKKFQYIEKEI